MKIYLNRPDYRLLSAYSGAEAVEIARQERLDLILMDIMMPGVDGLTALARIRAESDVPIILLTAKSEDSDKILGLNIGADDYVTKPFNPLEVAAREAGAIVYTRTDPEKIGKGYALDALLSHLRTDSPEGFDGYFVFDADNLLSPSFVTETDRVFSAGHDIVTGLRCSKNPTDNWVSVGYTLHFLRGCRFLNEPRDVLGVSAAVNGTGFFFSRRIAEAMGGWRYYLLTEDTQFSADMILRGEKIAYCPDAVFYDEQPVSFRQSWRQRLRWAKGFLQVFGKYGTSLFAGALRGSFSCFDMLTASCPVFILSALSMLTNIGTILLGLFSGIGLLPSLLSFGKLLLSMYLAAFAVGALVLLAEWKHIAGKPIRKLFMPFSYPLFLFTFLPITVQALFCRVEWKPIEHTGRKTEP